MLTAEGLLLFNYFRAVLMPSVVLLVFVLCVALIFYSYVAFPLLLQLLSITRRKKEKLTEKASGLPSVSVIMSVFNEEKVIAEKLEGLLRSTYKGKIEFRIGSDASNDQTAAIIRKFAATDSRVIFVDHPQRRGKPAMINDLIASSNSELIILTDANVFFEPETITRLVENFNDPEIGLAGATIFNSGLKRDGISHQEKSYIQRENMIKCREGALWGSMMGPFGGCYALRRELYEPVPVNFLVDDFFICMTVLEKGFRCVHDMDAICYEDVSNEVAQEYRRKARISAGNFQNLVRFKKFMLRPFSAVGFCFISHKVLRWITPFLIVLSLICLMILSRQNQWYQLLLAGELLLILSPLLDAFFRKFDLHFRLLRFISYFSLMNLALMKGFFRYLKGVRSGVWTPTKRTVT